MAERQVRDKILDNPSFMKQLVQTFLQEYLEQEVTAHLGAEPYERTPERNGHRNGSKSLQINTSVGRLHLSVPQVREGSFNTELYERYQRSEQTLIDCLQQMVIQRVNTRRKIRWWSHPPSQAYGVGLRTGDPAFTRGGMACQPRRRVMDWGPRTTAKQVTGFHPWGSIFCALVIWEESEEELWITGCSGVRRFRIALPAAWIRYPRPVEYS